MSSIPQNHFDENDLIDCVQRFFSKHHVGKLLAKCNGMKEKGVSPVSLLRYKLSNIFIGRSMYMQQRIGSFKEQFSKNTFYRFLNSTKTNWLRFTSLLAADIVNNDIRDLTNQELFFFLVDEMADITFNRSLGILMDSLMASLQENLKLSDEQLTAFTADFEARLPEYLRNALHPEIAMA